MLRHVDRIRPLLWSKGRPQGPFGKACRSISPEAFEQNCFAFFFFDRWIHILSFSCSCHFLPSFSLLSLPSIFLPAWLTPYPRLTKLRRSVPHIPSPPPAPSPSDGTVGSLLLTAPPPLGTVFEGSESPFVPLGAPPRSSAGSPSTPPPCLITTLHSLTSFFSFCRSS
jgi:hypothetical protein